MYFKLASIFGKKFHGTGLGNKEKEIIKKGSKH